MASLSSSLYRGQWTRRLAASHGIYRSILIKIDATGSIVATAQNAQVVYHFFPSIFDSMRNNDRFRVFSKVFLVGEFYGYAFIRRGCVARFLFRLGTYGCVRVPRARLFTAVSDFIVGVGKPVCNVS